MSDTHTSIILIAILVSVLIGAVLIIPHADANHDPQNPQATATAQQSFDKPYTVTITYESGTADALKTIGPNNTTRTLTTPTNQTTYTNLHKNDTITVYAIEYTENETQQTHLLDYTVTNLEKYPDPLPRILKTLYKVYN